MIPARYDFNSCSYLLLLGINRQRVTEHRGIEITKPPATTIGTNDRVSDHNQCGRSRVVAGHSTRMEALVRLC